MFDADKAGSNMPALSASKLRNLYLFLKTIVYI